MVISYRLVVPIDNGFCQQARHCIVLWCGYSIAEGFSILMI